MAIPGMYLISVSVCLGILYLIYITFFRFTTFFTANRYYLLGSLIFSFVVPVVELPFGKIDHEVFSSHPVATAFQVQVPGFIAGEPAAASAEVVPYASVLSVVYYFGVAVMLSRICYSIVGIFKIRNKAERSLLGNFKIFRADLAQPFSFFNLIFLPKCEIDPMIIEHEKVHVRQLHMIDLMMVELAIVLLWFNPLMFFYRRSVKAQHEYLADACTIGNSASIERYLNLLLHRIQIKNFTSPLSHFYSKSIKNRINMITRNKTSTRFYGLYLLGVPVCCILLFAFAGKPAEIAFVHQNVLRVNNEFAIIVDPGHGGADFGAKSVSGLIEKQLTMTIAKKMQQLGGEQGIEVILTRRGDETLPLSERILMSERSTAKMFISLHINTHKDVSKSGIECFISDDNIAFEESREFSDLLLNELKTIDGIGVNGTLKSNFYILKHNSIPAVVLELGFLSNKADYTFISDDDNQKVLAQKIISAVARHLK